MSGQPTSNVTRLDAPEVVARLQRLLDEAVGQRSRLNRRIRRIRDLMRAVEEGDPIVDLEERVAALAGAAAPPRPDPRSAPAAPAPGLRKVPAAPAAAPAAAPTGQTPFATALGAGLPAGMSAPTPPPPAQAVEMASVDIGRLGRMSEQELDGLPFGVVTLDSDGRIVGYNDTESRLVGLPRERVLGRSFFGDVAPCTAVREFEGRFRDFASGRSRLALETFEFVFNFAKGAQRVVIMISPARRRGQFHVSMIRTG